MGIAGGRRKRKGCEVEGRREGAWGVSARCGLGPGGGRRSRAGIGMLEGWDGDGARPRLTEGKHSPDCNGVVVRAAMPCVCQASRDPWHNPQLTSRST